MKCSLWIAALRLVPLDCCLCLATLQCWPWNVALELLPLDWCLWNIAFVLQPFNADLGMQSLNCCPYSGAFGMLQLYCSPSMLTSWNTAIELLPLYWCLFNVGFLLQPFNADFMECSCPWIAALGLQPLDCCPLRCRHWTLLFLDALLNNCLALKNMMNIQEILTLVF